jgi:hypothetical protein
VRRVATTVVVALLLAHGQASAQEARPSRMAVDTAVSVDETVDQKGNHTTGVFVDSVVSVGFGHGLETVIRPYMQRLPSGEWNRQIWLATMRYERAGRIGLRVDGGLIPPPVGYANMQLRPQLNPTIAQPSSLFVPLPTIEARGPRATLLGAVYPWGANATVSGTRWDARAAVMDTSPLRSRRIFAYEDNNPPRFTNVVIGAGVTPLFGLRLGASVTQGGWLRAGELPTVTADQRATVVTVETEYAVRYTKLGGEWTHDGIGTSHGDTSASGWFVQGQQTLTPRWFASGRVEHIDGPALDAASGTFNRMRFSGTEEVIGFRLTPGITVRAGHRARQPFNAGSYVHAGSLSIVWWRRWS